MRSSMGTRFGPCTAVLAVLAVLPPGTARAQEAAYGEMSEEEYIERAEAGGPSWLAEEATIVRWGPEGDLTQTSVVREGTNDITCVIGIPMDPDNQDVPFCADPAAWEWITSAVAGAPEPTNREPGIAYMAEGGRHRVNAEGETVMEAGEGTEVVDEPPHWMLFWPVDAEATGLPTRPNDAGVWVMFAGTPWAHLMVYQDPNDLPEPEDADQTDEEMEGEGMMEGEGTEGGGH